MSERLRSKLKIRRLIIKSGPDEYRYFKAFIGLLIAVITTLSFQLLSMKGLDFTDESQLFLTAIVGTFLCVGGVLAVQFRCIMLLMFPTFFGNSCRRLLIVLAIAQLAEGPVQNIYVNLEETVKTFSCAGEMAINMTLNRLELALQPVHDVVRALVVAGHDIQSRMVSLSDAFYPLFLIIEDDALVKRGLEQLKSAPGVEHLIDKLNQRRNRSLNIEKKPSDKLSLKFQTLCLKLVSGPIGVCSKIDEGLQSHFYNLGLKYDGACPPEIGSFCDDFQKVDEQLDIAYLSLQSLVQKMDETFDFHVQLSDFGELLDFTSVKFVKESIEDEIFYRAKVADFLSKLFSRFVGILFILIFLSAAKYENSYMNDIQYDNCYLTQYFHKIDERRKDKDKPSLLPLKHFERLELIDPKQLKLLPEEKHAMAISFTNIFPNVLIATVTFMLDAMLVYLLNLIAKHALLEFEITGEHLLSFEVSGKSFIAKQWRQMFHNNTYRHQLNLNVSTQDCLPSVSQLDLKCLLRVIAIYTLVVLSCYVEAYGMRLRRYICSLCYYKREKIRILWLYNSFLKRRMGSLQLDKQTKLHKIFRWNDVERDRRLLLLIRETFPRYFGWLRHLKAGKKKCYLCETLETDAFVECATCKAAYCDKCWKYLQEKCLSGYCQTINYEDEYVRIDLDKTN